MSDYLSETEFKPFGKAPSGNKPILEMREFTPSGGAKLSPEEFKPLVTWTHQDELRAMKYGRIAKPETRLKFGGSVSLSELSWWKRASDFVFTELLPFKPYLTEEGRRLRAGLPAEAQSQANLQDISRFMDWVAGEEVLKAGSVLAKKLFKNVSKTLMPSGGKKVMENVLDNLDNPPQITKIGPAPYAAQKVVEPINPTTAWVPPKFDEVIALNMEKRAIHPISKAATETKILGKASNVDIDKITAKHRINAFRKQKGLPPIKDVDKKLLKEYQQANTVETLNNFRQKHGLSALDILQNEDGFIYFHSGMPVNKEAISALVKDAQKTLGDYWWKPVSPKDIGIWKEAVGLPYWLSKKYPAIKKVFDIQMVRQDARAEITQGLLEGVDDFLRLKGDDYELTKKLLLKSDEIGKVFDDVDLIQAGASESVVKAYKGVRNTLNHVLDDYWEKMKKWGIPEDDIQKYRQQIGQTIGYFPRVRMGKYFVKASKEGDVPIRKHFNNVIQGGRIKRELAQMGYTITDSGKTTRLPEEVFFQISPEAIGQVVDVATTGWEETIKKELKHNIANVFKERGFLRHGLSRADFVKGFETDNLKQVLFNYLSGYSGFVTKMEASKSFRKELAEFAFAKGKTGIKAGETPELYKYATKYVRDVMENTDRYDNISSSIRAGFFIKYLGGVIKSGFVNLTQNFIGAAPRLSLETKGAYVKLGKSMGDIVAHYAKKGKYLPDEEINALRIALQKGWTREQYISELSGTLSQYGKIPQSIKQMLSGPMTISERFNRQSTFLAGFRVFRNEKGLPFDDAIQKASEVVLDSHFLYGKGNLPGTLRGSRIGKLARSAYTFRTFTHNYINLLSYLYKKDKKAVAKSLAAIGTIGGISSLPLFKTAESIASRYGYNPRSYLKRKSEEYGLTGVAELALYGIPSLLGIDLGGSIGIELPGQREFSSQDPKQLLLELPVDILGVPGSLVEDTIKSAYHLHSGDMKRAIEDSPVTPIAISNMMKALRYKTEGMTSMSGKPILTEEGEPVKLSTKEMIMKGSFGFQTPKLTESYRKFKARKTELDRWNNKKELIKNKYLRMANRYGVDSKQVEEAWDDIFKFNDIVPDYITSITGDTIRGWESLRKSKRSFLLEEAIR